jgi:LCP family protein required for cell wall assembly
VTQTPARPGLPPELDPRRPADIPPPPRPPFRARRLLTWMAVVTSAVIVLASAGLYLGFRHYNGKLSRTNIRLPQDSSAPAAGADGPAQNYLVVGSDTREAPGTQKFGAAKGSPNYVGGARSDTIMLLHIPGGQAKATLISFPRDSWVSVPAFTEANGTRLAAHHQRINSAFALGGAPLLVEVVQQLSGLRVDHYVQVDFAGFQRIVDALGGVNICVRTSRNDKDSGDYLTAGTHHVDGRTALAFARDRKTFTALGDLARIKDQQYLVSVLLHKVLSAGTLANPFRVNALVNAVVKSTVVDRELSVYDMRSFALRMRHLDPQHVNLLTAPVKGNALINGADVVLLDDAKTKALFDSLKGKASTGSPAPTRVTVAPADISLSVYNGAGTAGLASRGTADLRRVGFAARLAGNAGTTATGTVVRYGAGAAAKAATVVAAIPGATAHADAGSPAGSVSVILASDYSGAVTVQVGGAGTPTPKASGGSTTAAQSAGSCGQ